MPTPSRSPAIAPPTGHQPVLCREVIDLLAVPQGGCAIDATIGLGGHAALLLSELGPDGLLIGLDADEGNLERARENLGPSENVRLFHGHFENIEEVLKDVGIPAVDTVLADFGISSNQLDDPGRGFSFNTDGPLDMRIDRQLPTTAADLVNQLSQKDLADLIYHNAQERASRRIARAVCLARHDQRITTTKQLADIICKALKQNPDSHRSKIHPATRSFMALRIAVNRELEELERFVEVLPRILKPGGRAAVISFHSLEDGLCKRAFRKMKTEGRVNIITKRPITPTAQERRENPRSRSAKMRVVERTSTD